VEAVREAMPPGVELAVDLPQEAVTVDADAGRMEEVVRNLVRNAQDALDGGGDVQIALRVATVAPASPRLRCAICQQPLDGYWAQLTVADTGEGIGPGVQGHIFEPFFTTRGPQRRGLGLSQVLGIVKQHGGHLALNSEPGAGTAVTVYLPLATG
jgi:signal transduction histidine kinase